MGNKEKAGKSWHHTDIKTIEDSEAGGGVVVDNTPPREWEFALEDLQPAAGALRPNVALRGVAAEPRVEVYAGGNLVGFAPARISARMRKALAAGGSLRGEVVSVASSARRIVVKLRLESD